MELVPDWSKADQDGLKEAIATMDWEDKLAGKSGLESLGQFWKSVQMILSGPRLLN